jgi:hypothetical protein
MAMYDDDDLDAYVVYAARFLSTNFTVRVSAYPLFFYSPTKCLSSRITRMGGRTLHVGQVQWDWMGYGRLVVTA